MPRRLIVLFVVLVLLAIASLSAQESALARPPVSANLSELH